MRSIFLRRLCAGFVGSILATPAAFAWQQGSTAGAGGQATGTGTGGTTSQGTGTTSTGNTTTNSNYSGTSSVRNQSSSNTAGGMNLPQVTLPGSGGGAASGQGAGTAGRGSTGRRSAAGSTGQRAASSAGFASGGMGRGAGGQSNVQTNRQSERRAQSVTQLDQASFAPLPAEPGSTLELRTTIEQTISAAVPGGIQVALDGSAVVLSGKVTSAAESKLAERMALLEPGVRSVRNELVVESKL